MSVIRAAVTQVEWTGDKETMIVRHEETHARGRGRRRADHRFPGTVLRAVLRCRPGPEVLRVRRDDPRTDGRAVSRRWPRNSTWSSSLPIYEVENEGEYYNTAAMIDADGELLGKYRKHHIPNLPAFWEKFYFRPGNLGYPVFDTRSARSASTSATTGTFPEGWRELGLNGRPDRLQPERHEAGPVEPAVGARAGRRPPRPTGTTSAAVNRVGHRGRLSTARPRRRLLRLEPSSPTPRGNFVGERSRSQDEEEIVVRDLDLDLIRQVRERLAVLPGPPPRLLHRDHRPLSHDPNADQGRASVVSEPPNGAPLPTC